MQFKKILFFVISATIMITGCGSKDETNTDNTKIEKKIVKKVETKYKVNTTDSTILNMDIKDKTLVVDEIKNKIILLNFFATWCPPCKAEIPHLINLKNKYKEQFEIIAVNVGDKNAKLVDNSTLNSFIEEYGINYIVTNSKNNFKIADAMGGVRTIPTMFIFDKSGKLIQKYVGVVPEEMMETDIQKAIGK